MGAGEAGRGVLARPPAALPSLARLRSKVPGPTLAGVLVCLELSRPGTPGVVCLIGGVVGGV